MGMKILVTGAAGFIGSAVCRCLLSNGSDQIVALDNLTYAGNLNSLHSLKKHPGFSFVRADICDKNAIAGILSEHKVDAIMHLAAESHVDRSIDNAEVFLQTNVVGTFRLLEATRAYWSTLSGSRKTDFRFHHISTDEVFGDLSADQAAFDENSPYAPSSPYAASKASSDHFVRSWFTTYGLPVVISNCSNNYGPFHFPEKLIPLMILNALDEKPLPIYGDGKNVRDWLFVDDHAAALETVLKHGKIGQTYLIGGRAEHSNREVVQVICDQLDNLRPRKNGASYQELITFVADRYGHDQRYAINPTTIEDELHWHPLETFNSGMEKTVNWYLEHEWWWRPLRDHNYSGHRLGLKDTSLAIDGDRNG